MERNEPPRWMQDKHFNEVLFCEDFLAAYPMVCVSGSFFTVDGRITDDESIRKQIYEMLRPHFSCGLAKRASGLLEMLKLEAYAPDLPLHEDRIHVANGTLFLSGEFRPEKEFCRNRLPVRFDPNAPQPVHWLHFLSELLEETDILTLQEYLGYCLIPTNRGQVMMLLKGNGGEGKSRIGVVMQKMLGGNLKNGSIAKVERSPFARADLLLTYLDTLHQKGHVAAKGAHGLQALGIFLDLLGRAAVDHVPILAGCHWHSGHGEILVQHIEGGSIAAPAAGNHRCAHLHGLVDAEGAEKQSVHKGDGSACGRGKVHRAADDKGIRLRQLWRNFIDSIVKHALAGFVTLAAGNAAANILVAYMEQFHFDALGLQRVFQLGQGGVGAAPWMGATVY